MPQNASKLSSEKPLQAAVLCCTSVPTEIRTQLGEWAVQMGAEHRLDLTSDVTHLIVGDTQTAKYRYVAKQRSDVKVLLPEFVSALREHWMQDEVLDIHALEARYRVPPFARLKICITGFEDLNFRAQLQESVNQNGGVYSGDLTKDVTHLIALAATGKKYEYATLWAKKVVTLKWYHDTLQRGMQLAEEYYHPSIEAEQQGVGAWEKEERTETSLGKRQRGNDENNTTAQQEPNRKLRRTASARLGSQSDTMWNDIVGQPNPPSNVDRRETLKQSRSVSDIKVNRTFDESTGVTRNGFLSGIHFIVQAFETRPASVINATVLAHGGTLHETIDDLLEQDKISANERYLVIPHRIKRQKLQILKKFQNEFNFVTELWLEWCITSKRLVPVQHYPLGKPLVNNDEKDQLSKFGVNATGFASIQTLHISKVITFLGGEYQEVFTPETSVLICNSSNINMSKLMHAAQWKVPVVNEKWLWKLIDDGTIPPFDDYLLSAEQVVEDDFKARPKSAPPKTKVSTPNPTFHTQETVVIPTKSRSGTESQKSQNSTSAIPLKEVSVNLSPKKRFNDPISVKKKLFQTLETFDGTSARDDDGQVVGMNAGKVLRDVTSSETVKSISNSDLMTEFLQLKAEREAQATANARIGLKTKDSTKKNLLGRALSNLSNSSRTSNNVRKSRASSIDSMNTDGLGTEISANLGPMNSTNHDIMARQDTSTARTSFSLNGRAKVDGSGNHEERPKFRPTIDLSDPGLLRDEFPEAADEPQHTQLGYEESEEAIALKEKLAERRRAKGRMGQQGEDQEPEIHTGVERKAREKEKRVIKDDEALLGLGGVVGGRRTRQKEKLLNMNAEDAGDIVGRGGKEHHENGFAL